MVATYSGGPGLSSGLFEADASKPTISNSRRFAEQALVKAKREGLVLAVRARWAALAAIAIMLPLINPNWEVLYYEAALLLFALIGWAQLHVGRVGHSRLELALLFCDLALMTVVIVVPNPWSTVDWPTAMQYRFGNFSYFFVLLAAGTLAYNWRTVVAMGTWTTGLWLVGLVWAVLWPNTQPELTVAATSAFGADERLLSLLDPNTIDYGNRLQELVLFLIVAGTLALTVNRSSRLLIDHAAVERERANLARYFSPNVVQELSQHDAPLEQVQTQNVAVLFVDIVGFTTFSESRSPQEVISTLRRFHAVMEPEVFRFGGTLDKYLGDGLMATFGTPFAGASDATNALKCVRSMIAAIERFNDQRRAEGQPAIHASFGLHYGPVVLGDIGANRLEFAVLGSTVNVASRLESLTRELETTFVASDDAITQAKSEASDIAQDLAGLVHQPAQQVRGLESPMQVWMLAER
ncbi:MAG: adenylate/guanylate cyclase domain-containing protein [Hyphomicrobiaceae bacterium]